MNSFECRWFERTGREIARIIIFSVQHHCYNRWHSHIWPLTSILPAVAMFSYSDRDRYGGSSRESGHSTGSYFFVDIIRTIKDFPQTLKSTLVIEEVATSCRCCNGPLRLGHEFCSQECGLHYWENLRQRRGKISGSNSVGYMCLQLASPLWATSRPLCFPE